MTASLNTIDTADSPATQKYRNRVQRDSSPWQLPPQPWCMERRPGGFARHADIPTPVDLAYAARGPQAFREHLVRRGSVFDKLCAIRVEDCAAIVDPVPLFVLNMDNVLLILAKLCGVGLPALYVEEI
ncbi:hypothetical protein VDGL01_07799 [Verticillium dahliae]